MLHNLAVHMPNLLPDWHFFRPAGRLIWSTVMLMIAVGIILWLCKKPKPKDPATWAQAMLGAVVSFGLMLLAYGTIPHEWLVFANGYLKWDDSHFVITKSQWPLQFDVTRAAIKDIVASGIYVVFLGLNMKLFVLWQKRPEYKEPDAAPAEDVSAGTSAYGRPMTAKA